MRNYQFFHKFLGWISGPNKHLGAGSFSLIRLLDRLAPLKPNHVYMDRLAPSTWNFFAPIFLIQNPRFFL
jgi:hypothetical protein